MPKTTITVEMAPGLPDPQRTLEGIAAGAAGSDVEVNPSFDQPASPDMRRFFAVRVANGDIDRVLKALNANSAVSDALPQPEAER